MLSKLILITLAAVTLCGWTRTPQIKMDRFNKTESSISISTEDFKHLRYPNAYDLQMYYTEGLTTSNNITDYQKLNDSQLLQKGCSFTNRRIRVEDQLQIQLPDDNKFFFTDLAVYNRQAFLLRNDNRIFTVSLDFVGVELKKLSVNSQHLDFSSQIKINLAKKPKFLVTKDQLFVFTENGAISFNQNEWKDDTLPQIKSHTIETVSNINYVHFDEETNRIFVVAGKQGIGVYSLTNGELKKQYIISTAYNSIKVQTKGNKLFVLDDKIGIHFFTLGDTDSTPDDFIIPLENPISFIFNKNSFLVIAQTSEKIVFGIEVLIHFNTKEFYYNKFYLEDMQLRDVQQCGEFQYLIGYDVHKIVETNIYRGFVEDDFDYDTDFMVPLLERISRIEGSDYEKANQLYHYALALTPHYLSGLIIKDRSPEILCSSSIQLEQSYFVEINSTSCEKAQTDPFYVCHETHQFTLRVNEVLLDSQSQWYAEVFLIIVFAIFVLLLICGIMMCRKWRLVMANVQRSLQKAENKKKAYADLQMA